MTNDESITKAIAQAVARSYTPFSTPSTTTVNGTGRTDSLQPSSSSPSSSSNKVTTTTAGAIQTTIDRIVNKDNVPLLERPIVPASDTRYSQHRCHPRLQDAMSALWTGPMNERSYRFSLLYQCVTSKEGEEPEATTVHPPEYYLLRYRSVRSVPPTVKTETKGTTIEGKKEG